MSVCQLFSQWLKADELTAHRDQVMFVSSAYSGCIKLSYFRSSFRDEVWPVISCGETQISEERHACKLAGLSWKWRAMGGCHIIEQVPGIPQVEPAKPPQVEPAKPPQVWRAQVVRRLCRQLAVRRRRCTLSTRRLRRLHSLCCAVNSPHSGCRERLGNAELIFYFCETESSTLCGVIVDFF